MLGPAFLGQRPPGEKKPPNSYPANSYRTSLEGISPCPHSLAPSLGCRLSFLLFRIIVMLVPWFFLAVLPRLVFARAFYLRWCGAMVPTPAFLARFGRYLQVLDDAHYVLSALMVSGGSCQVPSSRSEFAVSMQRAGSHDLGIQIIPPSLYNPWEVSHSILLPHVSLSVINPLSS